MQSTPRSLTPALLATAAAALLAGCPLSEAPAGTCSTDRDCPEHKPLCIDGECMGSGDVTPPGGECAGDADCPGGHCAGGSCVSGPRPCASDEQCQGDLKCAADGFCRPSDQASACQSAYDCEPEEICRAGSCVGFDDSTACIEDEDCPADHTCQMGVCEGCFNDAFCVGSPAGPKCATTSDEQVPPGYCYTQCGPDVGDCPADFLCDTNRGGICVPTCNENSDCDGGLVCLGGRCEVCTDTAQCDEPLTCSQGQCVQAAGCTQAQCQAVGAAYYCEPDSGQCLLGCTEHVEGSCSALGLRQPDDCNPCPGGAECDPNTWVCDGQGVCDCAALDCGSYGQVCDPNLCACVPRDSNGGDGGDGSTCLHDSDCTPPMVCFGSPGSCHHACTAENMCMCESGACMAFEACLLMLVLGGEFMGPCT